MVVEEGEGGIGQNLGGVLNIEPPRGRGVMAFGTDGDGFVGSRGLDPRLALGGHGMPDREGGVGVW